MLGVQLQILLPQILVYLFNVVKQFYFYNWKSNEIYLDDQLFVTVNQPIKLGTRLCSNVTILPKLSPNEESQVKQETKSTMSNNVDDINIKIKEEPIESEEEEQQQQADPSPLSAQSETSTIDSNGSKLKETKKIYRKFSLFIY